MDTSVGRGLYAIKSFFNLGAPAPGIFGQAITLLQGEAPQFYCFSVKPSGMDVVAALNDESGSLVKLSPAAESVQVFGTGVQQVIANALTTAQVLEPVDCTSPRPHAARHRR